MSIILMIWNGISGLGSGTVILKGIFIMALTSIFWALCELAKHIVTVFAKMVVDALRHLTIMVRGWPKDCNGAEGAGSFPRENRTEYSTGHKERP
jgi:hypothetical protein